MAVRWLSQRRLMVAAVLVTSSVLLLIATSGTSSRTDEALLLPKSAFSENKTKVAVATAPVEAPAPGCLEGVLTAAVGAGLSDTSVLECADLADLALQYATAAAAADRFALRLSLPSGLLETLSRVFDTLSAERLDWALLEPPCGVSDVTEETFLAGEMLPPISVKDMLKYTQQRRLPLVLKKGAILSDYIASSVELIRKEFHFLSSLQQTADEQLDKFRIQTAKKARKKKSRVCTVGVLAHRKEYGQSMVFIYGESLLPGVPFYKAAADAMLRDLKSQCQAVAFVVMTDDEGWSRKNLLPVLQRKATRKTLPGVAFLMASNSPEYDLCLLASCQHTITDYETFGVMAAILADGRTIMYYTSKHESLELELAQEMARLVPQWYLIS